jgi:hypothetical protein
MNMWYFESGIWRISSLFFTSYILSTPSSAMLLGLVDGGAVYARMSAVQLCVTHSKRWFGQLPIHSCMAQINFYFSVVLFWFNSCTDTPIWHKPKVRQFTPEVSNTLLLWNGWFGPFVDLFRYCSQSRQCDDPWFPLCFLQGLSTWCNFLISLSKLLLDKYWDSAFILQPFIQCLQCIRYITKITWIRL